jgi:hypothetical protein
MAAQPSLAAHKLQPGSPYCSDPDCAYCKELRETEENLKASGTIPSREGAA